MKTRVIFVAALMVAVASLVLAFSIKDGDRRFKCESQVPCDPSDSQIAALDNDKQGERMLVILGGFSLGALLVGYAAVNASRTGQN